MVSRENSVLPSPFESRRKMVFIRLEKKTYITRDNLSFLVWISFSPRVYKIFRKRCVNFSFSFFSSKFSINFSLINSRRKKKKFLRILWEIMWKISLFLPSFPLSTVFLRKSLSPYRKTCPSPFILLLG